MSDQASVPVVAVSLNDWARLTDTLNQMIDVIKSLQQRVDVIEYHIRVFEQRITVLERGMAEGQ